MSSGAIFILIIWAMFPTLIIVAVAVKLWEIRQASRWPSTTGKVVISTVVSHKRQPGEAGYNFGDTEMSNEPCVEYDYQVNGRSYRGKRITIGEKTAGFELEGILARYPVGATVTVYYNPDYPEFALLERDLPMGKMIQGVGCLMLLFVGVPLLGMFVYFQGVDWLKVRLAHPERAPFVTAVSGFGLLVSLFAIAYVRIMRQAAGWPVAPGRIVASGVESYLDWHRENSETGPPRRYYKPSVVYRYEVHGHKYQGDRVSTGLKISATIPALADRVARRYPIGTAVDVHYNPEDPGESVLEPHTRASYFLWFMAAGMFLLAWFVATTTHGHVGP
jgi:hypothetical protein